MLLAFTVPAQAQLTQGSYTTSYSGSCSAQWEDANGSHTTPLQVYPGSAGSGASFFAPYSASVSGDIIGTLTWTPGTAPNPQTVILEQTATAQDNGGGNPPPSGSVDDGLGDNELTFQGNSYLALTSGYLTPNSTGTVTHYSAVPWSQTITETCSPTATFGGGGDGASGGVNVSFSIAASPVTISVCGATLDSQGNPNILVGQQCSPILTGIPSGCTVTSYNWSVSGSTFQYWEISPDKTYTLYQNGPGDRTLSQPSWYWNDNGSRGSSTSETITCTATVQPPVESGSAFSVTVTQPVKVWIPNWSGEGIGGTMLVNQSQPSGNGTDYWLWAGPTAVEYPAYTRGMTFDATISSPLSSLFSDGIIDLAQLITPDWGYTTVGSDGTTSTWAWSLNGQQCLDLQFPYGWFHYVSDYMSGDIPGIDLDSHSAKSAYLNHQFEDYLMYYPPAAPHSQCQYVPVANFTWNTNGSATKPSQGWAFFTGSAGSVSPSSTLAQFQQDNNFPMWTNIGENGYFVQQ